MKIVVNHLTRMEQGFICVAGLDPASGQHVRPVLRTDRSAGSLTWLVQLLFGFRSARARSSRLRVGLLARNGGPFDIAALIDIGSVPCVAQPPEVEDRAFNRGRARFERTLEADEFWALLTACAKPNLATIFGADLKRHGRSAAIVEVGQGLASLGCLRPQTLPRLYVRERSGRPDAVRMRLRDGPFDLDLSVSDIRLYRDDHVTPDGEAVRGQARRIRDGEGLILGVGLTRPFSSDPSGEDEVHWLQVTGVHLEKDPVSRLG